MNQPLLSIILPVHNGEAFLEQLMCDLLGNEYSNLEVLVGEDACTDSTSEIVARFSKDPRVRVFRSETNIGAGGMRNILLNEARGALIAIQDADDSFAPQRFVKQAQALATNAVDVVGTSAKLIDAKGNHWLTLCPPPAPVFRDWLMQRSLVHASIMFRRDILGSARYHEGLEYGEDYYFLTQLYLNGARVQNIPECLYLYHIDKSKIVGRNFKKTWQILRAKWEIGKLFSGLKRILFLVVNISWVLLAFFAQRLKQKTRITST